MVIALWGYVPLIGTFVLLVRARRQTGNILVKLDTAHRQLATYAEQIEHLTVTAERARLSRELHDTLAQGVAGLILQLEALESQLGRGDSERVAATLSQIKNRARATLKDSRQAIDDLRLRSTQSNSVLDTIVDEIHRFSETTGITCSVDVPPSLTLSASAAEHARRFVSEGLANIAKHAAASSVRLTVRVREPENEVLMEIHDDGMGFDSTSRPHAGHYGLLGLQERAQLVGGKFEVKSVPRKGTTLRFSLPISGKGPVS
jgi:NarL family two-component system sensor histidine kinase YdfH